MKFYSGKFFVGVGSPGWCIGLGWWVLASCLFDWGPSFMGDHIWHFRRIGPLFWGYEEKLE